MANLWQLPFHPYGLIIGIAVVTGITLAEKKALAHSVSQTEFWRMITWVIVGGVVGARLWHVLTDYYLYADSLLNIFKVWQGGLSVLGAVAGGLIGLLVAIKLSGQTFSLLPKYLDLSIFGLPIAQAIGRLGNWVNHELYGLPTSLPWAIRIPLQNRAVGYENNEFFHPLFAYEAILTGLFGLGAWLIYAGRSTGCLARLRLSLQIGTGKLFTVYLAYYLIIRFCLDFLRIEKTMFGQTGLGLNQLISLLLILVIGLLAIRYYSVFKLNQLSTKQIVIALLGFTLAVTGIAMIRAVKSSQLSVVQDHQLLELQVGKQTLTVEVANSPSSITQGLSGRLEIGSDGLLFIFDQPRTPQFWMREMRFDLDLVWIAGGKIVGLTENVPRPLPNIDLAELPRYSPDQPAEMVLEVTAGTVQEKAWKVGEAVVVAEP